MLIEMQEKGGVLKMLIEIKSRDINVESLASWWTMTNKFIHRTVQPVLHISMESNASLFPLGNLPFSYSLASYLGSGSLHAL
jgi:hypothetical protein